MSVMQTSTTGSRSCILPREHTLDRGQDVENQLRELHQFVAHKTAEGWHLVGEYIDQASGKSANRPEFQRLFRDAAERRFDLLLFWALDRFSREGVVETLQHLEQLKADGVQWWSFKKEFLRSIGPFSDAVLAILACIAKQERVRAAERVKAGLEPARAVGTKSGRPIGASPVVFDRARLVELRRAGESWQTIASVLKVSAGTARRAYSRAVSEPTLVERGASGTRKDFHAYKCAVSRHQVVT